VADAHGRVGLIAMLAKSAVGQLSQCLTRLLFVTPLANDFAFAQLALSSRS